MSDKAKIGVSSYSFSNYMKQSHCTYLDICDLAHEMGYDGIEFIDLNTAVSGLKDDFETARQIREHCADIGLEIIAHTVGANFLCEDPKAEVERVKHLVDVAFELGAPVMRHDAAFRRWMWPRRTPSTFTRRISCLSPVTCPIRAWAGL